MTYILFILLVIVYAACNVLRGSGKITKVFVYAGFAFIFAVCIYTVDPSIGLSLLSILAALSFGIDWLCNSFGWGDFFPHGRKSNTGDFMPARHLADYFYKESRDTVQWQTTAMMFRFLLTFGLIGVPLFAYALDNVNYLLAFLPFMLSGVAYRISFLKETKASEPLGHLLNGLLIGSSRGAVLLLL